MAIGAAAKSSHICSSTFFLSEGNRGCRTSAFSGSSEANSCRKRDFEYVKQTCSGSPLYICFVQINYVKATNRATLLELPVLFFLNSPLPVLVP